MINLCISVLNRDMIDINDPDTYVISKLNGKKYKRITHTHLKKYDMTLDEYKRKFNLTENDLVCKNLLDKFSFTKENCIKKHGILEGEKIWNEYCKKQSITNTFDYKNKKYGMTHEQFEEYNKNRSQTLENMIRRHGEEEGAAKWVAYCNKQKHAGCSLEYFIEKFGEVEGENVYKELCKKKAQTLSNYIIKYGKDEGFARYESWVLSRTNYHSKKASEFFKKICEIVGFEDKIFINGESDREYSVFSEKHNRIFFYDFVCTKTKKCIEFNGDCFHANPRKYNKDDKPNFYKPELTSEDIWKFDYEKICTIKEKRNIDVMIVWEMDYDLSPDDELKKAIDFLKN